MDLVNSNQAGTRNGWERISYSKGAINRASHFRFDSAVIDNKQNNDIKNQKIPGTNLNRCLCLILIFLSSYNIHHWCRPFQFHSLNPRPRSDTNHITPWSCLYRVVLKPPVPTRLFQWYNFSHFASSPANPTSDSELHKDQHLGGDIH